MPKENRKRGKKHKKNTQGGLDDSGFRGSQVDTPDHGQEGHHTPSRIVSTPKAHSLPEIHPETPFGYVHDDLKAYFRTVDLQIRDWQEDRGRDQEIDGSVGNEGAWFTVVLEP